MTTRFLRRADVEELTGLSRSTIYASMEAGEFPRPVRIGRRAVAWRQEDIQEWADSRPIAMPRGDEPVPSPSAE